MRDNLRIGAATRKDKAAVAATMEEMLDLFPILRERSRQLAGTLSGGEQQMLALARSLMSKPRLMLLDEPSLGLAPRIVAQIFELLASCRRAASLCCWSSRTSVWLSTSRPGGTCSRPASCRWRGRRRSFCSAVDLEKSTWERMSHECRRDRPADHQCPESGQHVRAAGPGPGARVRRHGTGQLRLRRARHHHRVHDVPAHASTASRGGSRSARASSSPPSPRC